MIGERMKHKRTRALAIDPKVKSAVEARDSFGFPPHPCCVLCGCPSGRGEAHIVPRSQSGLGIEENLVTLCRACHRELDQGCNRTELMRQVKAYMHSAYPGWDESQLVYRK